MVQKNIIMVWFRKDMRLVDHEGLHQAALQGQVLPVYILDQDYIESEGKATRWWMYHVVKNFDEAIHHYLQLYEGSYENVLIKVCKQYHITQIYAHAVYEPKYIHADLALQKKLAAQGIELILLQGNLLWKPGSIVKADGTFYKVFTPFFKRGCLEQDEPVAPINIVSKITWFHDDAYKKNIDHSYKKWLISPWDMDRQTQWDISEHGALQRLHDFIDHGLHGYAVGRDFPAQDHVSRLSPYIQSGLISVRTIWHEVKKAYEHKKIVQHDYMTFIKELCWREFSYTLLYFFPELSHANFYDTLDGFAWQHDIKLLHAWQQGKTGYPLIDAGMRELLQTGYMHNRVRMVVASFLIKNLLIDWRQGKDWFWQNLVDADLANNSASWQWVAGCGADAAPYFRIFNPTLQAKKFDKQGLYIRTFVPELAQLPDKYLFEPWKAPQAILQQAKIVLGKTYPQPIIDLESSRKKALKNYYALR